MAQHKNDCDLFILTDIPVFLVCLFGLILGLWGSLAAKELSAKGISFAVSVIFGAFPVVTILARKNLNKVSYYTKDGVAVVLGKFNIPSQNEVEIWTESVREHWLKTVIEYNNKKYQLSLEEINERFELTRAFFLDGRPSFLGKYFRGLSWGRLIYIGNEIPNKPYNPDFSQSLYRHEVSHNVVAARHEIPFTGEAHHKIFRDTGLGA